MFAIIMSSVAVILVVSYFFVRELVLGSLEEGHLTPWTSVYVRETFKVFSPLGKAFLAFAVLAIVITNLIPVVTVLFKLAILFATFLGYYLIET